MNPVYCYGCGDENRTDIGSIDSIVHECLQCGFQTTYDPTHDTIEYRTRYAKNGWGSFNVNSGYLLIVKEQPL